MYHKFIEAMKFAYGHRSQLGDMEFVSDALQVANAAIIVLICANVKFQIAEQLGSKDFLNDVRSKITKTSHSQEYYGDASVDVKKDHGTTTLSVIDGDGNAVSLSSSINLE